MGVGETAGINLVACDEDLVGATGLFALVLAIALGKATPWIVAGRFNNSLCIRELLRLKSPQLGKRAPLACKSQ
tara:strand:+ start:81 stop:302 length:222 start_codon:yes stop_codon:yes gene_type:complete